MVEVDEQARAHHEEDVGQRHAQVGHREHRHQRRRQQAHRLQPTHTYTWQTRLRYVYTGTRDSGG